MSDPTHYLYTVDDLELLDDGTTAPRDGLWLVAWVGGERTESEIPLPLPPSVERTIEATLAEVVETIRNMDGDALWSRALDGADMTTRPTDVLLGLIAAAFEAPTDP